MTYLPSLIKKIDDFYSLSESFTRLKRMAQNWQTAYMPDDEEEDPEAEAKAMPGDEWVGIYPNIIGVADSLSNERNDFKYQDIAHELQLIAELYRKALEINGGYHQMQEYIKRTMANIDMMIDDSEGFIGDDVRDMSDDILEEVSSDLRKRAKSTSITQQADEATATKELKEVKDNFNRQEARQEMESQKSVYEKGKPGQETGHGISARPTPETPERYAREIARLRASLESERDPKTRASIDELGTTLVALINAMKVAKSAEDAVKVAPEDPETVQAFKQATENLERLRYQRQLLKRRLNKFLLEKDQEELEAQYIKARNPAEKKWLEERIKLIRLRQSSDLRKRDEIKARKALINSLGVIDDHGDFQSLNIPETEMMAFTRGIQLGEDRKVSKADYDRVQSVERAKSHGKIGDIEKRQKGRRGGGSPRAKLYQYNWGNATFHGLVDKLGEKINTATHVSRLAVTQVKEKGKAKTHNALKPYVDNLSKAIQKGDKQGKYEAVRALKAQLAEWKNKEPAIKTLEKNVRLLPYFKTYEAELDRIASWKKEGHGWELDDNQRQQIATVISKFDQLIKIYRRYYQGQGAPGISLLGNIVSQLDLNFSSAIEYISTVLNRLEFETGIYAQREEPAVQNRVEDAPELSPLAPTPGARIGEEPEVEEESGALPAQKQMTMKGYSARMKLIAKLLGEEKLFSIAQEIPEQTVDVAAADRLANEVFDKLFDETMNELDRELGS